MVGITQLILQLNALILLLLKAQKIRVLHFFVFLAPTCFNPRGSSSGSVHSALLKLLKIKNYGSLELR
jgi:hypothetical protein